jgi:hypothetical protein
MKSSGQIIWIVPKMYEGLEISFPEISQRRAFSLFESGDRELILPDTHPSKRNRINGK